MNEIITGDQVRELPPGSAVLIWSNSRGERLERPHSAQIVSQYGNLIGGNVMNDVAHADWHYLVLWRKGDAR
jgi:hypothetical protein